MTIEADTASKLIALQSPQPVQNALWMYVLLVLLFLGLAYFYRSWKLLLFPVIIAVAGVLSYTRPGSQPSFRMSVDSSTGEIRTERLMGTPVQSTQSIFSVDLSAAEMQSERGATRVALVLRDGEVRYPLGELHHRNEPEQYVIFTKIRDLIGQTAPRSK